ncbi:hypothetical protein JCM8115_004423 [Rhodotorula mucilaginosa]
MAYNGYTYGAPGGAAGGGGAMNPYGGEEYAEHLAPNASVYQPRYSEDPFSGGSAEPYSSLPMGDDPEMVDLSGRGQRPLSGGALSSDAGASSAYWQPGARGSVGGVAGYDAAGDDWDEPAGQDSLWRRKRWVIVAAVLGIIAALGIGLGVGLGVGLNKNNGSNRDNAARLSNGQSSSADPRSSFSVGTFIFTSTSYGSDGSAMVVTSSGMSTAASSETPSETTTTPPPSSSYYLCRVIPNVFNPCIIIVIVVVVILIARIARINYTLLILIFRIPHYLCIGNDPLAIPHDLFATCRCHLVATRLIQFDCGTFKLELRSEQQQQFGRRIEFQFERFVLVLLAIQRFLEFVIVRFEQ